LVVKYELANRVRELVALPSALSSACSFGFFARRGSSDGLDRIGGRTELVRGDVRHGRGLASSVGGVSCCPTEISGRAHCMSAGRTSLHHLYLAAHPGAGMLDRLAWPWVLRSSRLEKRKNVLRARRRPQREEMVIRICEGPTAAQRDEARVTDFGKDHRSIV
jgi:hypothetical protein